MPKNSIKKLEEQQLVKSCFICTAVQFFHSLSDKAAADANAAAWQAYFQQYYNQGQPQNPGPPGTAPQAPTPTSTTGQTTSTPANPQPCKKLV